MASVSQRKSDWAARIQKQATREADHRRFKASGLMLPVDRDEELRLIEAFVRNPKGDAHE